MELICPNNSFKVKHFSQNYKQQSLIYHYLQSKSDLTLKKVMIILLFILVKTTPYDLASTSAFVIYQYTNTRVSQKFCNILVVHEARLSNSRCFCYSCERDKSYWTVRCQVHLILS